MNNLNTHIALVKSESFGLECWDILMDNTLLHRFVCKEIAQSKYIRICQKLGIEVAH